MKLWAIVDIFEDLWYNFETGEFIDSPNLNCFCPTYKLALQGYGWDESMDHVRVIWAEIIGVEETEITDIIYEDFLALDE